MVSVELSQEEINNLINLLAGATVPMSLAKSALKTLNTLKASVSNGKEEPLN